STAAEPRMHPEFSRQKGLCFADVHRLRGKKVNIAKPFSLLAWENRVTKSRLPGNNTPDENAGRVRETDGSRRGCPVSSGAGRSGRAGDRNRCPAPPALRCRTR